MMKNVICIISLILLVSCTTINHSKKLYFNNPDCRIVFTTQLDENDEPMNNLEKESIISDYVFIYVNWFNIPQTSYNYTAIIYNSAGDKVSEAEMKITPTNSRLYTFSGYKFDRTVDTSGIWRFQIKLDDVIVIDKEVNLTL